MDTKRTIRCRSLMASGLLVVLAAIPCGVEASLAPSNADQSMRVMSAATTVVLSAAPGFEGRIHKGINRLQRGATRIGDLIGEAGDVWLEFLGSLGSFIVIIALSSVADRRMFTYRHEGPGELSRYLGRGIRMFFRLVRDRRTPFLPRSVLVLALLYWLLPTDLIPDRSVLPGFLDDLVIAVCAAKCFMYLCPDALVQGHAMALQRRARA